MATARPIGYAGGAFLNPNVSGSTPPPVTTRPVARLRKFTVKRSTAKMRAR
jgi:hypothetical protein